MTRNLLATVVAMITLMLPNLSRAQETTPSQTIRGKVKDKDNNRPLAGVLIQVDNGEAGMAKSDSMGEFSIADVPVGRHDVRVTLDLYRDVNMSNVIVNSGKQTVLQIEMTERPLSSKQVTINSGQKDKPNNEMAVVSSRLFSIDETQRYAGSLGDPARMAANFAGVSGANDSRNDIVIRGNSPSGLLWRVEGMDIPSPNHFSAQGTTGGPVSILNNNTLRNSDFMTSAFPAEYGNASSGVFDLKLRNGNSEKYEYTGQIGFNGFELMAEGPIRKGDGSSFLASYRYSVLGIFDALGINLGPSGIPKYQDLTVKVNLPTKKAGTFEFFNIGGISTIELLDSKQEEDNFSYGASGSDVYFGTDMLATGIAHTINLSQNTYLKTVVYNTFDRKRILAQRVDSLKIARDDFGDTSIFSRQAVHSFINSKINNKNTLKVGVIASRLGFDVAQQFYDTAMNRWFDIARQDGNSYLLQAYGQWRYSINEKLSVLGGLHGSYFVYNEKYSIEPRAGLRYEIDNKSNFNVGYGLHGQLLPLIAYFDRNLVDTANQVYYESNRNIGFMKSNHFVIGYDRTMWKDFRVKSEVYYQRLSQVPVEQRSSSYSAVNMGSDFINAYPDSLVNEGTGTNYGIELTLEKFFSNNYYFLVTGSVFDSRYTGSDKVERNTAFNTGYTINALGGKEWNVGKRGVVTFSGKGTYGGGRRRTPIDVARSIEENTTVYNNRLAFSQSFPNYIKFDVRLGFKLNGRRITQEWALDVQNITNAKNVLTESYDVRNNTVRTEYQLGLFPMFLYRVNF